MSIRVAIADDQPIVRDGLRLQLQMADDLDFVGEASNGEQAVSLARQQLPDVILMDVRMPIMDGIEAARRIVGDPALAGVRVLILTTFDLDEHVYGALAAGASGFLLKDALPEEIVRAIRVIAAGDALLAPAVTRRLVGEFARQARRGNPARRLVDRLTDREREVLALVARGLSNGDIARELVLSPLTAKTHVSRILTKLGAHDRAQLVVLAYESGVVVPGQP